MAIPKHIYRCDNCTTPVCGKPAQCGYCKGDSFTIVGPTSAPFDPIEYLQQVKQNLQEYCHMVDIMAEVIALKAMRTAKTMDALKDEYTDAAKAAKAVGDADLLQRLTEAKDAAKARLSA